MRKTVLLVGFVVVAMAAMSFASFEGGTKKKETIAPVTVSSIGEKQKGNVLVAYFTWPEPDGVDASSGASRVIKDGKLYGNTEFVARLISDITGGELFAIETEKRYPSPHKALIDEAKKEAGNNERPKIKNHIRNLRDYDVIFVGYPNWWYDMPMVIYSFFDEYDFKGKTLIPFVTHGGSRFSQSVRTIRELEKEAKVIEGPSVSGSRVPASEDAVVSWLEKHGWKK